VTPREYLFSLEQIGIKLGLDQIRALLAALDHPDWAYPSIVVAGTNGKGSVTAMVDRALRAAGYRCGRYTSPHLTDLEERFVIDGAPIDATRLDMLAAGIRQVAATLPRPPSFFEATTAIALDAFREAGVEVAVLEVGLGGRLDATNAVDSRACAITSVDFDHEAYLGNTIEAIAGEKAGIIKPGGLAVLGENPDPVKRVVRQVAAERSATLVYAPDGVEASGSLDEGRLRLNLSTPRAVYQDVLLGLRGRHQMANAIVAVRLLEEIDRMGAGCRVPTAAIRAGLENVEWPGRLELRHWRGGDVLIDGAHNPAGARALAAFVDEAYGRPLPFVIGLMKDKHVEAIVQALVPVASAVIATAADSPRAAAPAEIAGVVRSLAPSLAVECQPSPIDAVKAASSLGNPVVVAGSLYLAGAVRAKLA
jgi:dihydrofolate synthase/folylpolyglutamate synthase